MRRCRVIVLVLFLLMLVPSFACSQVPDWHSELVFKVPLGDKEEEFAVPRDSKEMEYLTSEGGRVVEGSYFIDKTRAYIFDIYRQEFKIYELATGRFVRSIPYTWDFGKHHFVNRLGVVEDVLVVEDTLYVLSSRGTDPPPGLSFYTIYTYDIRTGKQLKRYMIHNPWLGTNPRFTEYPVQFGGITFLSVGEDKSIYVYDRFRHKSYRIISHGKPTPEEEHALGIAGRVCGARRYYWKREEGQTLLLKGKEGEAVDRVIPTGWNQISQDGSYLLAYKDEPNKCERCIVHYVYRYDGAAVGRIVIDFNQRGQFISGFEFFVSDDGEVYELGAYDDGVYLYRWKR